MPHSPNSLVSKVIQGHHSLEDVHVVSKTHLLCIAIIRLTRCNCNQSLIGLHEYSSDIPLHCITIQQLFIIARFLPSFAWNDNKLPNYNNDNNSH
jgi:hypothetical protein